MIKWRPHDSAISRNCRIIEKRELANPLTSGKCSPVCVFATREQLSSEILGQGVQASEKTTKFVVGLFLVSAFAGESLTFEIEEEARLKSNYRCSP